MNLWYCEAKASTHNGVGSCHVIAHLQMEVLRVLDAYGWGRSASEISTRMVRGDLDPEQRERLYRDAINWEDWRGEIEPKLSEAVRVERAARAANLEAGRQRGLTTEDDWETLTEQERGGWRLVARTALGAAQGEPLSCHCWTDPSGRLPEVHKPWCPVARPPLSGKEEKENPPPSRAA